MFRRILVANRGEIALRVMRTAREMGVETVAVYSDFDRLALHTRLADRAVALGGALPSESYLVGEKILEAARASGAEAIHPGYGFLAENAAFARAVTEAGLTWIGPPPDAISVMGDKIESRRAMQAAGVPVVPGLVDPIDDVDAAVEAAGEIGFPIALKAAAGGGGKGIRIVREPSGIAVAFRTASGEATSAFGDGRLYMERYVQRARHVELQVLFDHHGGAVHFGERECSIQRRHQKLIEECPAVVVDEGLRERMGEVALRAGHAVGYQGAGTVEFLFCEGEFFFLEMNTRLQVEHPVTEMVTGVDLVREQLRVASGEEIGYAQEDVVMRGHAFEVRVNAEDPVSGFLPSTGTVKNLRLPGGPWVRVDSALYRGMEVGLNYDPLLAKIVVWGEDRGTAIERMRRALAELNVGGVRTSVPAALTVLDQPAFREGDFDTHFLESLDLSRPHGAWVRLAAAIAAVHRHDQARRRALGAEQGDRSGWVARDRTERIWPR
ncbi:MAG: acetyl-CoA carboxylase biotin carboxylase subunit [Planctomycetota bacterium]|jgi:acetyl-CoA carboxylase biotin carboxylase subunit|nr:acetyl-CoA carboxylase biotin carboxylase subunit [Planctomycetota bacterium]MDP6991002.1 acetyl-CoA carboxylase biotin carboxylase subunit [Planctomycetota bacterium]